MGLGKLIRRGSKGSLDTSLDIDVLESRLTEKTDLIDELSTIWPIEIQAPSIIAIGARGSGKSTMLETLTGVPLPHNLGGSTRRPLKVRIVSDPTCVR